MSVILTQPTEKLTTERLREWAKKNPLRRARVTTLAAFAHWRNESYGDDWILSKVLGVQTEDEDARERLDSGTALHGGLEHIDESGEGMASLTWNGYRFDFNCAIDLVVPKVREFELSKCYDDMQVIGHADGICGEADIVVDYKTTRKFDADYYIDSFQWKFYLDMSGCKEFLYQIFVVKPFAEKRYSIQEFHKLRQHSYPTMHEDCLQLVRDYKNTVVEHLEKLIH